MKKLTALLMIFQMIFAIIILPASAETETEFRNLEPRPDNWYYFDVDPLPAGDPWYARGYILVTVPDDANDEYYRSPEAYPEIDVTYVGRLEEIWFARVQDGRYIVYLKDNSFGTVNDAIVKLSPRVGKDLIKVERDTENVLCTDKIRDFTDIYDLPLKNYDIIVGVKGNYVAYPNYCSVDAYPGLDLTGVELLADGTQTIYRLHLLDQSREGVVNALEILNARSGKDLDFAEPCYISYDVAHVDSPASDSQDVSAPVETAAPAAQPPAPQQEVAPRTTDRFAVIAAVLTGVVIAGLCVGTVIIKKKAMK